MARTRRPQGGQRSDARAMSQIGDSGWDLIRIREPEHGFGRFVARKRIIEDDHSVTLRFESSLTLGGLARNVQRRERES